MKKIIVFLAIFVLQGCFFSTQNSTFYMLESFKNADTVSQKRLSIAVADINLADYLQKPQIVLQKQNTPELKISEFNRWGTDLGSMIQNTLIEDFQEIFPKSSVKPLLYGLPADYVIKINIEKMSGYFGQKAILRGSFQILSANGRILKGDDFELQTDAGKTYASFVEAQSKLLSELASKIASRI